MIRITYVPTVFIRPARLSDAHELAVLCALLWPDGSLDDHERETCQKIADGRSGTLPVAIFVADSGSEILAGFIEVGLRSHADGCDTARPAGFIEGWFVRDSFRGKGIGRQLVEAAEFWAREQGCVEIASDALIDNRASQEAHSALGFAVVDRCVHFKKRLRTASGVEK